MKNHNLETLSLQLFYHLSSPKNCFSSYTTIPSEYIINELQTNF
jgi:hypothetical protein